MNLIFHKNKKSRNFFFSIEKNRKRRNIFILLFFFSLCPAQTKAATVTINDKAVSEIKSNAVSIFPDQAFSLPNDSHLDLQWGLSNNGSSELAKKLSLSVSANIDANIYKAWDLFSSKREIIVAVIDTGVDITHEDLAGKIYVNKKEKNGSKKKDDDGNGYKNDIYGWDFYHNDSTVCHYNSLRRAKSSDSDDHGTHCAGIIAAVANNHKGIAGVASNINVKILPIKVLGGTHSSTSTSKLVKAIQYAQEQGASICNASWSTTSNDAALKKAIAESDMLFVCGVGNSEFGGYNIDRDPSYPASWNLPNVISVSAINPNGTIGSYALYGKKTVDIAAPGTRILSTLVGNKYGYMSGTSMAAPFVTGISAMLYAKHPSLYPNQAKAILLNSTRTLSSLKSKVKTGGMIDAYKAVTKARSYTFKKDKTKPSIKIKSTRKKSYTTLKVTATDKGGSYLRLMRYASGTKKVSYFKKGKKGNSVPSTLKIKKSGTYTFYALDAAGNETIKKIKLSIKK